MFEFFGGVLGFAKDIEVSQQVNWRSGRDWPDLDPARRGWREDGRKEPFEETGRWAHEGVLGFNQRPQEIGEVADGYSQVAGLCGTVHRARDLAAKQRILFALLGP